MVCVLQPHKRLFYFPNTITSAFWSHPFLYITHVSNCVICRCKHDLGPAITNVAIPFTSLLVPSDGVCAEIVRQSWFLWRCRNGHHTRGLQTVISGQLILSNLKCSASLSCSYGMTFNHISRLYFIF